MMLRRRAGVRQGLRFTTPAFARLHRRNELRGGPRPNGKSFPCATRFARRVRDLRPDRAVADTIAGVPRQSVRSSRARRPRARRSLQRPPGAVGGRRLRHANGADEAGLRRMSLGAPPKATSMSPSSNVPSWLASSLRHERPRRARLIGRITSACLFARREPAGSGRPVSGAFMSAPTASAASPRKVRSRVFFVKEVASSSTASDLAKKGFRRCFLGTARRTSRLRSR